MRFGTLDISPPFTPSALVLAFLWVMISVSAWANPISEVAQVLVAVGEVTATSKDNASRPLEQGSMLYQGDTIITGKGQTQIRFTDDTLLSLYKNTRFAIDDYNFSKQGEKSNRAHFSLVHGLIHTLTGTIAKEFSENYKLQTMMALLSVRGTDFSTLLEKSLHVSVSEGAVSLENAAGSLLVEAGQMAMVADFNTLPDLTFRPIDAKRFQLRSSHRKPRSSPAGTTKSPPPTRRKSASSPRKEHEEQDDNRHSKPSTRRPSPSGSYAPRSRSAELSEYGPDHHGSPRMPGLGPEPHEMESESHEMGSEPHEMGPEPPEMGPEPPEMGPEPPEMELEPHEMGPGLEFEPPELELGPPSPHLREHVEIPGDNPPPQENNPPPPVDDPLPPVDDPLPPVDDPPPPVDDPPPPVDDPPPPVDDPLPPVNDPPPPVE